MYFCTETTDTQQDMEDKNKLTVKEWDDADKPREKMLTMGKKELSNSELIAILLRSGMQGKSAIDVAREVLSLANNSLTTLSRLDYKQLSSVKGMAVAKATTLMAALELGWRMQSEMANDQTIVSNSGDIFRLMLSDIVNLDHEEFWAIYLNSQRRVLGKQRISMGGQNETTVDIRVLFRSALENKATFLVVVHNHPAGSLKPSTADKHLTQDIVNAGKLLNITLVDHLIIALGRNGQADYYSFADNGLI